MEEKLQTHYTVPNLKELGWTDKLIEKHLGEPDKLARNPIYRTKPPMKLYLIDRVRRVVEEKNLEDTLQLNLEKRAKRSKSALKSVNTKRKNMLEWVDSLSIDIPIYDYPVLIEAASAHYNSLQFQRAVERNKIKSFREATIDSDPDFLYRIIHNFLRHSHESNYEAVINEMFGQTGKQEAYELLHHRITLKICETYPELITLGLTH